MLTRFYKDGRSPCALHLMLASLLCLIPLTMASGQGVGSTRNLSSPTGDGGNNIIKGRLIFPPGVAAQRIRVRLESNMTTERTTTTDANGEFIFNSLPPATYSVIVEATPDFEAARETVTIDTSPPRISGADSGPRTLEVPIPLRPKGSPAPADAFAGVPKQAVDLYNQALASEKKGDSKKAVEQLNSAVTLYPNFPLALNDLGVQYIKLGQLDKALEVLQKAVKLSPTDFFPHLNYGFALLNKKDYAGAESELREALKIRTDAPTAHMYLGIVLLTTARDEKTKQYNMERYNEAQKELETAAASGKAEVALAHKYLGGIYMGNKEYKRAADELEIYLKLSPKAPDAEKLKAIIKDLRSKS